jgi:hypothetical protein
MVIEAATLWWVIYMAGPYGVVPLFGSPRFPSRQECAVETRLMIEDGVLQLAPDHVAVCWLQPPDEDPMANRG